MARKKRAWAAEMAARNIRYAGKPDKFAELLEKVPEDARTTKARDELEGWHRFLEQPWAPDALTEPAIAVLARQPNIWLDVAVDLMAFGTIDPPADDNLEIRARRKSARAKILDLCNCADPKIFHLIGIEPEINIEPADRFIEWLRSRVPTANLEFAIEPRMIEPMAGPEGAGYVPFCSVPLWMMTNAGSKTLKDAAAWDAAVSRLLPRITTGEIEVIGKSAIDEPPDVISGRLFSGISIVRPTDRSAIAKGPWIGCIPYNAEIWRADYSSDILFQNGGAPAWTHLQLKKSDVLREFQDAVQINKLENNQKQPIRKKEKGKVPAILKTLPAIFPIDRFPDGVPDPAHAPRLGLISDLLQANKKLGKDIDRKTLSKAIALYNKSL